MALLARSSMHPGAPLRFVTWLLPAALALCACGQPIDGVSVCFLPSDDRIIVRASRGCAIDHEGATLSCEVTQDGAEIEVTVSGQEGTNPNDACPGDLVATCESEPLAAGEYTVSVQDELRAVSIPNVESDCEDSATE